MKEKLNYEDLPKYLNNAADSLRLATIERKANLDTEITTNFILIKRFLDFMISSSTTASGEMASKFFFILSNVFHNLKHLPKEYKKKVQDEYVCSIFYDLDNLYEFCKARQFPVELDSGLSSEIIRLISKLMDLFSIETLNGKLQLKSIQKIENEVIKFDRDSKHFQYFSYSSDKKHLNQTIKLIVLVEQIDLSDAVGKYQLLSAISQIFEHLNQRMLSPRMIHYLSSDINVDDLSSIRNFILHREQDLSDKLQQIIDSHDNHFLLLKQELSTLKKSLEAALNHLNLAVKPRTMKGSIFQRAITFTENSAAETISSINKFYEKAGERYKYTKIPLSISITCGTICNFESTYAYLSQKLTKNYKDLIVSTIKLGNRKLFLKVVKKIDDDLRIYFRENKLSGYNIIKEEVKSLKKDTKVKITELQKLQFSKENHVFAEFEELLLFTKKIKIFKNKLIDNISKLQSSTHHIQGKKLYLQGVDFDSYRVIELPLYKINSLVTESYSEISNKAKLIANQRYNHKKILYKLKLAYSQNELSNIELNQISLGISFSERVVYNTFGGSGYLNREDIPFSYVKVKEMIITNIRRIFFNANIIEQISLTSDEENEIIEFIIKQQKLQFVLIPLTHAEHAFVYQETLQPYKVSFHRHRVLDKESFTRLTTVIVKTNMQERMKTYLAFLETSENLLMQPKLLLEAELYLIFIAQFIKKLSKNVQHSSNFKAEILINFRNYLAHDRELGDTAISHSHEQITLRFVLEFTRHIEKVVVPALHTLIATGITISQQYEIIALS